MVVLERCSDNAARDHNIARFVHLKRPLERVGASAPELRDEWLAHDGAFENDTYAVNPVAQYSLRAATRTWAATLRSSPIHARAVEIAAAKRFPRLRDLAEVRFGVKSGANGFFYLTDDEIELEQLEPEYFAPLVFSLKEIPGYTAEPEVLRRRLLRCDKAKSDLHGTRIGTYIQRGERDGLHERPTCANRKPWYALARGWTAAPLLFPSKIGERMPIARNDAGALEDKKFYGITPHERDDTPLIAALLNSTITRLFVEFGSRQLTGSQAIADVDVVVAERLPLPDPHSIAGELRARIVQAYEALARTRCESLFVEFGSDMAHDVQLSTIKPDLQALDALVMGELWGLSDDEQLAVYRALVDHVAARLEKARSVTPLRAARSKTPATA
jgi:hypothetical protein